MPTLRGGLLDRQRPEALGHPRIVPVRLPQGKRVLLQVPRWVVTGTWAPVHLSHLQQQLRVRTIAVADPPRPQQRRVAPLTFLRQPPHPTSPPHCDRSASPVVLFAANPCTLPSSKTQGFTRSREPSGRWSRARPLRPYSLTARSVPPGDQKYEHARLTDGDPQCVRAPRNGPPLARRQTPAGPPPSPAIGDHRQ